MKETLEEAAKLRYGSDQFLWAKQRDGFIEGAKWQQERMYSEEEVIQTIRDLKFDSIYIGDINPEKWFKQFKKK